MTRFRKIHWVWVIGAVLVLLVAYVAYVRLAFHLEMTPITEKDLEPYAAIGKLLEAARSQPSLRVDDSSVGYPEGEAKLRVLQQAVSVFQGHFLRSPKSLGELPQIFPAGPEGERARKEMQRDYGNCRIFTFESDSYALNCDGLNAGDVRLGNSALSFDRSTTKFYLVDHHVIIYVPPMPQ